MIWLFCTVLLVATAHSTLDELNIRIAELEARVMLLADKRAATYGYDQLSIPIQVNHNTTPTIDRIRREYFLQGLTKQSEVKSGTTSFLLNIRQQLFLAESYPDSMTIFNEDGKPLGIIKSSITHYSYIKSPSQPLIGFLSTKNNVFLCNSDTNFTDCSQIELKSQLPHYQVVALYIAKIDNKYLICLASQNGKIHVFDQQGSERSIMNTSFKQILKIVDHAPYPVIVSPTGFSMLQPNRMIQVDLGCPIFDASIIDATAESAYSSTLYILFSNEIMGYGFSSKKQDKECKMSAHLKLAHNSGGMLAWMNPILFMNNSFLNTSDVTSNKQLLIPLQLCQSNSFQSAYRKHEFYFMHKCCNSDSCQTNLYRKGKLTNSTNKFYKFGIFIVLLLVVTFKMFNRSSRDPAIRREDEDDLANREQARIKQIIDMFEKDKPVGGKPNKKKTK